jgi:hypothetical protein
MFTVVAKMTIVRVLLFMAINNGWALSQMDVKNTFFIEILKKKFI